jgi:hypothetical protein
LNDCSWWDVVPQMRECFKLMQAKQMNVAAMANCHPRRAPPGGFLESRAWRATLMLG